MEAVASWVTVGQEPRSLIRTKCKAGNIPPVLDEESREARSPVSGWAVLDTDASVAVGVGHVRIGVLGIHLLTVPAGGEGDFGREAVLAGAEALGKTIGEDGCGATVRLVAAPTNTGWVVAIRTLEWATSDHVEVLWVRRDVCPVVAIPVLVVDLGGQLGYAVKFGSVGEEQSRAPVQGLVGFDTSSGAVRGLGISKAHGLGESISSVERVEMRALSSGE